LIFKLINYFQIKYFVNVSCTNNRRKPWYCIGSHNSNLSLLSLWNQMTYVLLYFWCLYVFHFLRSKKIGLVLSLWIIVSLSLSAIARSNAIKTNGVILLRKHVYQTSLKLNSNLVITNKMKGLHYFMIIDLHCFFSENQLNKIKIFTLFNVMKMFLSVQGPML